MLDASAFLTELAMLAALIYVGLALPSSAVGRIALVVLLPAVFVVVWGRWLAPRAPKRLAPGPGLALKVVIFATGSALLGWAGPLGVAVAFFAVTEGVVLAAATRRRTPP